MPNLPSKYAADGWTLDRIVAGETAVFMGVGDKGVFLLVFTREKAKTT